jgi:two-component sensor histidine kinase
MQQPVTVEELLARRPMDESPELRLLFHRLNNQLGIILAHAELLEAKAADEMDRARATQVVSSALEAMATAKEIRRVATVPAELNESRPES